MVVDETTTVAARLFAAIEAGDLDAVRDLYAPDVQIWHNVTNRAQTRDENLKLLGYFTARVAERRYEVHARDFFPGGFVQRHTLHGTLASGARLSAPVCIVVYVAGGKIERLYEYLDPGTVSGVFA
jgi:ketosteroid isomerase-like protein